MGWLIHHLAKSECSARSWLAPGCKRALAPKQEQNCAKQKGIARQHAGEHKLFRHAQCFG
jgi:hypothetical protein